MIDYNCFTGNWPFHKIRKNKFSDIVKLHQKHNIEYGYISSLESIFYNDPYEAELDLYNEIKGSGYKQIMTVNPTLDITENIVNRGIKELGICGVRILPGIHGYSLKEDCVKRLASQLKENNLPLYINMRLEDERCSYIIHPYPVNTDELCEFINENQDIEIMLCTISFSELMRIKETVAKSDNVHFDISGFKDKLFALPELRKEGDISKKARFGSTAPLFVFESAYLIYTEED